MQNTMKNKLHALYGKVTEMRNFADSETPEAVAEAVDELAALMQELIMLTIEQDEMLSRVFDVAYSMGNP